jgi:predicted SnoaL-like aldol condensation-catalyzing enzyme
MKEISTNDATKSVVMNHLNSFLENDLEGVLTDYNDKSVLVTHTATYEGVDEIRVFFTDLMKHFPKQRSAFELDKFIVRDGLVYITWHADTPTVNVSLATDTFIVREGKIYQQTFAGEMKFVK